MMIFFFLINGSCETPWGLGQVVWIVKESRLSKPSSGASASVLVSALQVSVAPTSFHDDSQLKAEINPFMLWRHGVYQSQSANLDTYPACFAPVTPAPATLSHHGVTAVGSHDHSWDPQKLGDHAELPPPLICVFQVFVGAMKSYPTGNASRRPLDTCWAWWHTPRTSP